MSASGLRLKVCGDFWHSHPTSTSLASHVSWTDLTRVMCGMLRWRSEQAWQTNTPKVSDAQSGSAGETEKGKKGEPGGIREMMKVKERERGKRRKWNLWKQDKTAIQRERYRTNKKGGVQKSCYEDALTKRTAAQGSDYKYWRCWCQRC